MRIKVDAADNVYEEDEDYEDEDDHFDAPAQPDVLLKQIQNKIFKFYKSNFTFIFEIFICLIDPGRRGD